MGKKSRNPKKAAANALKRAPGTDEEARDPSWVSQHLKCEDCQSDYFAPPAMVCMFPGCARARCGDCVSATGPALFRCCPICKAHLCVDHGFELMTPAGPEDPMAVEHWTFGMKCESCEATREVISKALRPLLSMPASEGPVRTAPPEPTAREAVRSAPPPEPKLRDDPALQSTAVSISSLTAWNKRGEESFLKCSEGGMNQGCVEWFTDMEDGNWMYLAVSNVTKKHVSLALWLLYEAATEPLVDPLCSSGEIQVGFFQSEIMNRRVPLFELAEESKPMLEMGPGAAVTLKVRINDFSYCHQNQRFIIVAGPVDAPIHGCRSVPIDITSAANLSFRPPEVREHPAPEAAAVLIASIIARNKRGKKCSEGDMHHGYVDWFTDLEDGDWMHLAVSNVTKKHVSLALWLLYEAATEPLVDPLCSSGEIQVGFFQSEIMNRRVPLFELAEESKPMLEMDPGAAATLQVRINDLSRHHENRRFVIVAGPDDAPIRGSRSVPIKIASTNCRNCGKAGSLKCEGCKTTRYCSKECQKVDWRGGHREECNLFCTLRNMRTAVDQLDSEDSSSAAYQPRCKEVSRAVLARAAEEAIVEQEIDSIQAYVKATGGRMEMSRDELRSKHPMRNQFELCCGNFCQNRGIDFRSCPDCRTTKYCSEACHKAHAPIHDKYCATLCRAMSVGVMPLPTNDLLRKWMVLDDAEKKKWRDRAEAGEVRLRSGTSAEAARADDADPDSWRRLARG